MRLGRLSHVHVRGMRVRPCEEVNGLAKAGACVRRLRQDAGGRMCVRVQFDVRAWSHQAAGLGGSGLCICLHSGDGEGGGEDGDCCEACVCAYNCTGQRGRCW